MKIKLRSTVILLSVFLLLQSCQKEIVRTEIIKEITIDTTIAAGSDYLLELAPFGDEGDMAKIIELPSFASISQLENETDMFTSVYHYTASTNGIGKTDQVTLAVNHYGSADSTVIYLNIFIK